MKKIFERIKKDKDFRFDFFIGVWSAFIIIGIVIAIIIGVIMIGDKVNNNIEETEAAPSATPVATASPTPEPSEEPEKDDEDESSGYDEIENENNGDDIGSTDLVYATTTVNVRQSASTASSSLGKIAAGESVERLESLSNGWSKVIYNEQEAYIKSEYLSSQPVSQTTNAPQRTNAPKATKVPKATKAPKATKVPANEAENEEMTEETENVPTVQPTEKPQEEEPVSTEIPDVAEPTDVPPASDNLTY